MATFLKRQKEMKRLEKQREKAERRAQKKLAGRTPIEISTETLSPGDIEGSGEHLSVPSEADPQS
jgi:hypothetical protein